MQVPDKTTKAGKSKRSILIRRLEIAVLICLLLVLFIFSGRALSKIALIQISALTNTKITTKSVIFNLNGSVIIKGLKIRPQQDSKYNDFILKAEKVYARFGIGSLLLRRPQLKKITIKNFIFNIQQDMDTGLWNLASIKISGHKGDAGKIPFIRLKGGILQYSKVSNGVTRTIAAIPIEAGLKPNPKIPAGYSFNIATAKRTDSGKSTLLGFWQPGKFSITGSISSDIPTFERTWSIDALNAELNYGRDNTYKLKLNTKELLFTHSSTQDMLKFADSSFLKKFNLFTTLQFFFDRYNPTGRVALELDATGNLNRLNKSTLNGKVTCKDVSICDRRFPYELNHLTGQMDFTEKSVSLNNLEGKHKAVDVALNGTISDFGSNRKYQIRLTSNNMALDNDLYDALSESQKQFWSAFYPDGLAKIDYQISRQSQTERKKVLEVHFLNAQALYKNFPYPLKNLTGTLLFDGENIIIADVTSQVDDRKITLNGKATVKGADLPGYDISIDAKNIPLDSTLRNVLPAEQKQLENQFDIINKYGQGTISLTGRFWSEGETDKPDYNLLIHTEQLELEDDLIATLPEQSKAMISQLQPKGKVNYNLELNKSKDNEIDYKVIVELLGNSIDSGFFPYPIRDIKGNIAITSKSIELQDVTATTADNIQISPSGPQIKLNGKISRVDEAFDNGEFSFYANDILLDERLGIALPGKIRPYYFNLSATGRFDLNFENVKIFNSDDGEKYIDFEGTTRLKSCNFNVYPDITNLDAILKTSGLYKTGYGLVQGEASIAAENITIRGKSITNLKADLHYDKNQNSWLADNLIAKCYDGTIIGRFGLEKSTEQNLQYSLQAGFYDIDLKQFLSSKYIHSYSTALAGTKPENITHSDCSSGKMSGSLGLAGQFSNDYLPIGRCRLKITDMKAGKLSPIAKMLQVLKLTEPKDFAFNQMIIDSYIQHNKLLLEQVDISGDTLAFNGSGWIYLPEQNINLSLAARGERLANIKPSAFQSLTESLGHAVVRIDVTGKFNNPDIKTTSLPVLKEAVGLLGTKVDKTQKTK